MRSPHSATVRHVCIQMDNATPTTAKPTMQIAQVQPDKNQPDELEFTEAESY